MLQRHGIQKPDSEKTLHLAGPESLWRHSGDHSDSSVGHEIRQQFDAGEDDLTAAIQRASYRHIAFGLSIESNLPLTGLPVSGDSGIPDIHVNLQSPEKFQ